MLYYFRTLKCQAFLAQHFRNCLKTLHSMQCNKFLTGIERSDDQQQKLTIRHITKTYHKGINEMITAISSQFYWPKMTKSIEQFVNNCETSNLNKYDRNPRVIKFNLTLKTLPTYSCRHIHNFQRKLFNNHRHILSHHGSPKKENDRPWYRI